MVPFGDFATFLLEQLALPDPVWYAFVACNGEDDSGVRILAVLKNHGNIYDQLSFAKALVVCIGRMTVLFPSYLICSHASCTLLCEQVKYSVCPLYSNTPARVHGTLTVTYTLGGIWI